MSSCATCAHPRVSHRTIGMACVDGLMDCDCPGFAEPAYDVHPDEWTGEGILAMLAANPEPEPRSAR